MTNLTGKPEVFCLTFLTLTLHYLGLPWKFPSMEHYLFFFFLSTCMLGQLAVADLV